MRVDTGDCVEKDWTAIYSELIRRLPGLAASAPITFCGSGACVDARVAMRDVISASRQGTPDARRFADFLQDRAARGQGGEVTYDWPGGPDWLGRNVSASYAIGGTGPHAAWTLSVLGAPTLLALEDRSELMLQFTPADVFLASDGRLVRAAEAKPVGAARRPVFNFEYTAGVPLGSVVPDRSSRVIVKFGHFGLERDPDFDELTAARAGGAGAGSVSGFTSVARDDLRGEVARIAAQAGTWREGGLETVHLELGSFDTADMAQTVVDGLRGMVTSVGMSLSELIALAPGNLDMGLAMREFANTLQVERVCIHADSWAASLTRWDPDVELDALLTGCLLAASRAAVGVPVMPLDLDPAAIFETLPSATVGENGDWRFVGCASPFLRAPRTTLGLGDTFTSGCLLALGAASRGKGACEPLPSGVERRIFQPPTKR